MKNIKSVNEFYDRSGDHLERGEIGLELCVKNLFKEVNNCAVYVSILSGMSSFYREVYIIRVYISNVDRTQSINMREIRNQLRYLYCFIDDYCSYVYSFGIHDAGINGTDLQDLINGRHSDRDFDAMRLEFKISKREAYLMLGEDLWNEKSTECSNPECDNILDSSDEKCTVCGELKI